MSTSRNDMKKLGADRLLIYIASLAILAMAAYSVSSTGANGKKLGYTKGGKNSIGMPAMSVNPAGNVIGKGHFKNNFTPGPSITLSGVGKGSGGIGKISGGIGKGAGNISGISNKGGIGKGVSSGSAGNIPAAMNFTVMPGSKILVRYQNTNTFAKGPGKKIGYKKMSLCSGDAFAGAIDGLGAKAIDLEVPNPIGAKGPNPHHGGLHKFKGDGNPGGGNGNGHWGEGNQGNGKGNNYTGNQGKGVGEGMAGGGSTDTDSDMDNDTDTNSDTDTDSDTDLDIDSDLNNDSDDILPAAALAKEPENEVKGCPALMGWLENEVSSLGADVQAFVTNTFATSSYIQPCETCAKLRVAAAVLEDIGGTRIAALGQIINEYATPGTPISEEQMALIASAFSKHSDDNSYYAQAGKYIEALAEYIMIMSEEIGINAEDALALYTENYFPDDADITLTAYLQNQLSTFGG